MERVASAMYVLFGDYVDINKMQIPSEGTPEELLIAKETFTTLSEEVKELITLIANAPERLYMNNGVLNRRELQKYLRRRKGWSRKKAEELKFELWFFLRAMTLG